MAVVYPVQTPKIELQRRVVGILRGDAQMQTFLFPAWAKPKINDHDDRVYRSQVTFERIPSGAEIAAELPRVLIETRSTPLQMEQDDLDMASELVNLYAHVLVPKNQYLHGDRLLMRVKLLLLSTQMSDSRIIASDLYAVGDQIEAREAAFNDAHRLTQQFRSESVGVRIDA